MASSKSLFYIRNSQLIRKTAQSTSQTVNLKDIFVDRNGRTSDTAVGDSNGYYYTANGDLHDNNGKFIRNDKSIATSYLQGVNVTGNDQLTTVNRVRASYGLNEYYNMASMIAGENKLKQEYEAARRSYTKNNKMTNDDFNKFYPNMYEYMRDVSKGNPNRVPGSSQNKTFSFNDAQILDAIKKHDIDQLNLVEPSEVFMVFNDYIKALPRIRATQTLLGYEKELRRIIMQSQFINIDTVNYIISIKIEEANEIASMNQSQLAARQERDAATQRRTDSRSRLPMPNSSSPQMRTFQ